MNIVLLGLVIGIGWMVSCVFLVRQSGVPLPWPWLMGVNLLAGVVLVVLSRCVQRRPVEPASLDAAPPEPGSPEAEALEQEERAANRRFTLSYLGYAFLAAALLVPVSRPAPMETKKPTTSVAAAQTAVQAKPIIEAAPPQPAASAPFKPVESAQVRSWPTIKLQGITFNPPNSSVIINGRSWRMGDTVDEVRVIEIRRTSVILDFLGQSRALTLD